MIPIVPMALPIKYIKHATIYAVEVQLHKYAVFRVSLNEDNGVIIQEHYIKIDGEEYDNWGSDDTYIKQLVLSKIGVELFSEPQPEPEQ